MKRYLFFVFLTFFLMAFAIYLGGSIARFLDVPSILLLLLPLSILLSQYKFSEITKFFKFSFSDNFETNKIKEGILFYNFVGKVIIFSAIVISIIQFLTMLSNINDISSIGPQLAIIFLYTLYNMIIYLIIILPLRQMLIRKSNS